ncbi:FtsX-like permease family protein [Alginatibacterium sediminis]|uniref:FtsX-like permease family protein n=1 Tax=Alginatibacterium sediminis TaxID=2164068 RepID=A0A420EG92_9ALTE|nr:FtsX-like permease family protein [Alginatibacterium sediminis]RKF19725.1 FtsX-like permease family protein [Alginatibacterium sediminis]
MFSLSWRLFRSELRRGELSIIAAAIVLAVVSVWLFSSVSARIERAIVSQSSSFIAADRVLRSAHEIEIDLSAQANQRDLGYAEQLVFSSMLFANDDFKLASVKAVSSQYPLRGRLSISEQREVGEEREVKAPNIGEAWLAERLFYQMDLNVGDPIYIGDLQLKIAGRITQEPDAPFSVFMAAPRVIINIDDVEATGVVQPGSRLSYRYMFSGQPAALDGLGEWLKPQLQANQSYRDVSSGSSALAQALQKSEQFLLLAGLIGVLLAATAVAVASKLYGQRHYDSVAIFKVLGASRSQVRRIYIGHLSLVITVSIIVGLLLGLLLQVPIDSYVQQALNIEMADTGYRPLWLAALSGLVCGFGFSLPPLAQLFSIAPLRVIRREQEQKFQGKWQHLLVVAVAVFALLLLYSNSLVLSAILFGVGIAVVVMLLLLGRLFLFFSRKLSQSFGQSALKLAAASLQRNARDNAIQLIGFTIAIQLSLVVYVVQNDLIGQWQSQLPEGTPNHFVLNIDSDALPVVEQAFAAQGISDAPLYPMLRARLTSINDVDVAQGGDGVGEYVDPDDGKQQEQRRGVGRELNLSATLELPYRNEIQQGQWLTDTSQNSASVELEFAERLGLKMGDKLKFLSGNQNFEVTISSIRSLDWSTMQPNFYVILSPDVIEQLNVSYMSAFFLEQNQQVWLSELLNQVPTLIVIDVAAIIGQVNTVVGQISLAMRFVLVVVVLASLLVLLAQVQGSLEERRKQTVILRTIGASGALLRNAIFYEFFLLGAIAGLMAAISAQVIIALLQIWVLSMPLSINWMLWLVGPLSGGLLVAISGWLSTRSLLRLKPSQLVRQLG